MILIKKDGVLYFCESALNSYAYTSSDDITKHPENLHIMRCENMPNRIMLANMPMRAADALRYEDIFPKRLTAKELAFNTYPKVCSLLEPFGLLKDGEYPYDLAFAHKDKCYVLRGGGMIDEVEEFFPLTSASNSAIGAYILHKDKPIYEMIFNVYREMEDHTRYILFSIIVMNTKTNEVKIINREDFK